MSTLDRRSSEDTAWPDDGDRDSLRDLTDVTVGDFKIEKLLGRGGMGEVYLATQLSLSRHVALKVLRPNLASNPTYLGRLRTEATAVARRRTNGQACSLSGRVLPPTEEALHSQHPPERRRARFPGDPT